MAEQAGKERLNNNEFRELIPHLPLADLLRIEYRKDKWYKLITVSDPVKKLYGCSLCSITNSNVKNLTAHMEGKKHKVNINDVKQLFHPEYTYMKQDWKLAVGAGKPPVGAKTSVQKVKINDGASTSKPENNTSQAAAKTNKNEAAITLKPENITQNVVTTNKNEETSSSSALKNKAITAKNITTTKAVSKPITALSSTNSTKSVTTNSTPAAKASINTTKVVVKAGVPKIPAATAAKKASITPVKPLIKPQVGTQSINAAKPTISNNTQSTIGSNTKQAPDNTIAKNPAKANTFTVAKPNQLNQHTQVATKQISKANNESASAKNSNISETEKHDTAILSASRMKSSVSEPSIDFNVQKETSQNISVKKEGDLVLPQKIGPNANDPSWNPKVSVKNLNVAKLAKTTEANTSQRDPKDQSPTSKSKFSGIKVSLKKVRTTEKSEPQHLKQIVNKETSSVNTPDTDNTTQSSGSKPEGTGLEDSYVIIDLVEKEKTATKVNPDPNLVSSADNELTRDSEATKLQSRNIQSIDSRECELNEKQNADSIKAKFDQSEFSNDVQFDEMLVKFDDKLNVPQTNLVKNPFALKHDGSKSRVVKISCISTDKLKKPVTEKSSTGDMQISQEVIVIDDDSPLTEQNTEQNLLQNYSVIGSHLPKPQRDKVRRTEQQKNSENTVDIQENTTKRNSESGEAQDSENLPKKQKVVLNPAAAFLVEATSEKNENAVEESVRSDKPKYQTDRIIIPTVHKPKHDEPTLKNIKLNFSTKTFSSKPKDDDIHGLLGVEYVVKIMKSREDISPRYECSLCELILDGPSMQNHLVAYNHRLKFCEKHFPTALRQYRQYLSKVPSYETYKVLTPILAKLAVAIEQHHGRDLPYEVLEHDYNVNRHEILSKVFSCRHASEQYGPAFTHVLDAKEIDVIIAQKDNFKPQVGPPVQIFNIRPGGISLPRRERKRQRSDANEKQGSMTVRPHPYLGSSQYRQSATSNYSPGYVPPVDDETHKKMVADFLRGTHQSGSPGGRHHDNRDRERRSRRSRSRERARRRSRSRSNQRQQRNLRKSISPLREGDIWQAYRHLVDQKVYDLNEVFKLYRSDPETHPMYNDEWQKFWKRRKDELIAAGLDHRSYNYQPEWVRFFKVRIEELYSQALENIKIQSRERLCLPMSNNSLTDSKYHVQARNVYPGTPATDADNEDCLSAEMMYRQKSGNPNVIAVLRLLTALEEHLGSLGPKIIDLMSKALLIEKSHPDQINDIILTMDNCTLLQTAMEKLKGLLFAGLLEGTKERAFKKVIADTELLLSFAEEERKKKPSEAMPQTFSMPNKPIYRSMAPAPVPAPAVSNSTMQLSSGHSTTHIQQPTAKGSSQVDKKELAAKLAATLTAQGKTDFNPDQLEQLIAVYTLIEKKKREAAAATMSTSSSEAASFQPTTSMSNRKTLSDTLVDFMNPSNPNSSNTATTSNAPENSIAKQSYTAATINRYLEVMRRMGGNFPNSGVGNNANEIWHNLQNIQRGMGANTNVNQSREGHSANNTFDYVGPSSFSTSNQFGINSIASKDIARKDSLNMGSNANLSFRPNSVRGNLNTFVGGMGGNQPQSLLSYQQQNSYLANTISQNLSSEYNSGGSTFGNTNNNSRVNPNNIGINPKQPNQQNRPTQSFQGKNPNQNWVTKAAGNFGINKRRNNQPRGGGSEGGGPRNTSGIGKNQIWRNN